jgi:hypothetical protein
MTRELVRTRSLMIWIYTISMTLCFLIFLYISITFYKSNNTITIIKFNDLFSKYLQWYSLPLTTMIVFTFSIRMFKGRELSLPNSDWINTWSKLAIYLSYGYCSIPILLLVLFLVIAASNTVWLENFLTISGVVFTPIASAVIAFYFGKGADETIELLERQGEEEVVKQAPKGVSRMYPS